MLTRQVVLALPGGIGDSRGCHVLPEFDPDTTMNHALLLAGVFSIFIPALLLPGPDFVAVVRSSMTRGPASGLMTTLGVSLGLALYATLSLIGLSAILVQFEWLAWTVRILGGCYLVYLGIRLVLSEPRQIDVSGEGANSLLNSMTFGFLVTMTNPKAVVLFTSVFATAVSQDTPLWLMGTMIALVFASSLLWYAIVSLFMSSRPVIRRFGDARSWIEKAAGVCFVGIGGRILADARNPIAP